MRALLITSLATIAIAMAGCSDSPDEPKPPSDGDTNAALCPKNVPASESFDVGSLVGMTLAKARLEAAKFRCEVRPVSVDGRKLANVQDTRDDRVNVALEKARIARIVGVY